MASNCHGSWVQKGIKIAPHGMLIITWRRRFCFKKTWSKFVFDDQVVPLTAINENRQERLRVVLQRYVGACLLLPSLTFFAYACHLYWTCRLFSGPWGIVVMRVSWPGHPTLIKKKKTGAIYLFIHCGGNCSFLFVWYNSRPTGPN